MKAKFYLRKLLHPRLAALALALVPAISHAQDPYPTPTPVDPLAGVPVQVLEQQQVEIGTHLITYNRIVPPTFPAPAPTPAPQATAHTSMANHGGPQPRSGARSTQSNDAGDGGQKEYKILFLSATVYDHQFTALRFYNGGSPELSAYVNIDFNYFRGIEQIETADTIYIIMFGMGNDTVASLTQAGQTPPNLAAFPAGYSAYQVTAGNTTTHADDLAALDALCLYYDAHRAQMIADYQQREANNAAHQQWLLDHPPVQPDTVMYFWPVKSSTYLNQAH